MGKPTLVFITVLLLPLSALAYVSYDNELEPLYGFSDTLHPEDSNCPTYDYRSITSVGTRMSFSDVTTSPVPIGFPFEYYGQYYEEVTLSPLGIMGFESFPTTSSILP